MENTNYVGLSYQLALERKMDIVSNNIANVNTNGYKSSHMMFQEHVVNAQNQKPMSMVLDYGNFKDLQQGPMQSTGNPLDVAIEGNGFFGVQTPDGEKYTRSGNFKLNSQGQIVTSFNMPVTDAGGQPITIPSDSTGIHIAEDGTVSTDDGEVGKLKVVRFNNPQDIKAVGNDMFEAKDTPVPDTDSTVHQGVVEASNVNSVMEMTDMIEILRKYQSMAHLLQNNHDMEISMIDKLSQG